MIQAIEQTLGTGDLCRRFKVSPETVWRWRTRGVLTETGRRAKLKSIKIGGRRRFTPEAVDEFIRATSDSPAEGDDHKARVAEIAAGGNGREARDLKSRADAAARELDRRGI